MTNVLMVFPRFNQNSFWSLQAVCDTYGSRTSSPPLGLMTVAALLPPELGRSASSTATPTSLSPPTSTGPTW